MVGPCVVSLSRSMRCYVPCRWSECALQRDDRGTVPARVRPGRPRCACIDPIATPVATPAAIRAAISHDVRTSIVTSLYAEGDGSIQSYRMLSFVILHAAPSGVPLKCGIYHAQAMIA